MKRYVLTGAQSLTHTPNHPERTARRSLKSFDVQYQEWPNRSAMARSIRMQQSRESRYDDWRAVQPLRETEGY